ncbi:NADPH-dependent ferric siderophore reductase [Herbihabitans rhizosphaerae]|uniref:NADPH-dependent ferric siderophore reductase n=1 Tax=Herbihabitans rhizosphaerae TaxID=1872711 RepID=A0A4Q7KCM2_9PSEU|nr:siderophore-interacting protein [Herbihabitans rhizosphaerae]RZS31239.1 NADPH-dependent ferric siderophore reductase [Herbihabitans rhizosphaerae]
MSERQPVRLITVRSARRVTPRMVRVTFEAGDLPSSVTDEPDQQVKLYIPRPGQREPVMPTADGDFMSWYQAFAAIPDGERPWMRSYTLRGLDAAAGTVDVDFVIHEHAGPATRWAMSAAPGDVLAMFGPSATFARLVPLSESITSADHVLIAGDETALPAVGTILEWLPAGTRVTAYLEVVDAAEHQVFTTRGEVHLRWVHRGDGSLVEAVRRADLPDGSVFAWLAGEAGTVRELRRHLVDRGVPKHAIEFTGYWRARLTQDDAPTEQDLADARERLPDAP